MKILFIASDASLPGQGGQAVRLALAAKAAGDQTSLISLKPLGQEAKKLSEGGVEARSLPVGGWRLALNAPRLALAILFKRPEIIQTFGFQANILGKILGFLFGARLVVSSLRSPEPPKMLEMERVSSFLSAKTLAPSAWLASLALRAGISKSQVLKAPLSCDLEAFKAKERHKPHSKDSKWQILFLGERCNETGVPLLIAALDALAKGGVHFKAELAGKAHPAFDFELSARVKELGLESKVSIEPEVPHEKVPALMAKAHLLVAPNVENWTPNTILEAFASSLPVVATDIEGVGELVRDGKTGRLAKPLDPGSLLEKISLALGDYERSVKMAREAHRLAAEEHSVEKACAESLAICRELLEPEAKKA